MNSVLLVLLAFHPGPAFGGDFSALAASTATAASRTGATSSHQGLGTSISATSIHSGFSRTLQTPKIIRRRRRAVAAPKAPAPSDATAGEYNAAIRYVQASGSAVADGGGAAIDPGSGRGIQGVGLTHGTAAATPSASNSAPTSTSGGGASATSVSWMTCRPTSVTVPSCSANDFNLLVQSCCGDTPSCCSVTDPSNCSVSGGSAVLTCPSS